MAKPARRLDAILDRMRRAVAGVVVCAVVVGMAALWLLSPEARREARFLPEECRRLALSDPRTGKPVVGVEDMALAPNGDTLILSAYDRRDPARPDGGLYALNLSTIWTAAGAGTGQLLRLDAPRAAGAAFRPHGIALDPETGELAVINRTGVGVARVEVGPVGPAGWTPTWVVEADRLCRANDLDFRPQGLFVTLDRADCAPSLRDMAPWTGTGALARLTPEAVLLETEGLDFPNGISGDAVAETRAKAIRLPGDVLVDVPGGPDNLTRDGDGALVAAVHPGLLRLFLMREGVFRRSGSRIVRLEEGRPVELLFDDPGGETISGATVGLLAGRRLLIGSATDAGIVVCEGGE